MPLLGMTAATHTLAPKKAADLVGKKTDRAAAAVTMLEGAVEDKVAATEGLLGVEETKDGRVIPEALESDEEAGAANRK